MVTLSVIVPATDQPATLARCLDALRAGSDQPDELTVVDSPHGHGPAAARNQGAQRAAGDVLVFVDADVEAHRDALARIRRAFDRNPNLSAVFGSYDDDPGSPGLISDFRNLLHRHVHHEGAGEAMTFWAGLGSIRLSEFRYADATAIAVVMLLASFLIIFAVNRLQRWAQTRIPAH